MELALNFIVIGAFLVGAFFFAFGVGNHMGNSEDKLEEQKKKNKE